MHDGSHADAWTFKSSLGQLRRIDYILSSASLDYSAVSVNDDLDLGTEHKVVGLSVSFKYLSWKTRKKSSTLKGWWPDLDQSKISSSYHIYLNWLLREVPSPSLQDISQICQHAAQLSGSTDRGPHALKRPGRSSEILELLAQRKHYRDGNQRKLSVSTSSEVSGRNYDYDEVNGSIICLSNFEIRNISSESKWNQ